MQEKQKQAFREHYGREPELGEDLTLPENKVPLYSLQDMIRFGTYMYQSGESHALAGRPTRIGKSMDEYFMLKLNIDLRKQLFEGSQNK